MKLILLEKGTTPKTLPHLLQAAKKLKLDPLVIDVRNFSSQKLEKIKHGKTPYLLYNTVDTEIGFAVEADLFQKNTTTFYNKIETIFVCKNKAYQYIKLAQNKLPIPKTVITYDITNLQSSIDLVNGFPLIIKTNHGERGIGVIKIDSFDGLLSTLDLLKNQNIPHVIQEYIDMDYYVRTVFVGEKELGTIRYDIPKNDFRLVNFREMQATLHTLPEKIISHCKKAMNLLDTEFAGIDLLVKDNQYYISEVNFPCIYLNTQKLVQKNISEKILEYLILKQKKQLGNCSFLGEI